MLSAAEGFLLATLLHCRISTAWSNIISKSDVILRGAAFQAERRISLARPFGDREIPRRLERARHQNDAVGRTPFQFEVATDPQLTFPVIGG